jgi:hypothetical protein
MTKAVINKKLLVEAKFRNLKLKKNALDNVDINQEAKTDPKFKTELCKSWVETGFCIYGNKCRFAHGKLEIFVKPSNNTKYKQKNCLTFFQQGFCNYGKRCHFKHDERTVDDITLPYFTNKLLTTDYLSLKVGMSTRDCKEMKEASRRLPIFKEISNRNSIFMKVMEECKSLSSESKLMSHNDNPISTRILTHFY